MKVKRKGSRAHSSSKGEKAKEGGAEKTPYPRKVSLEPLYKTTDRYRQVIKPMRIEDFLS